MNDVPLIQKADINSINTSIIAIKKQLKQLNEALGLVDMPSIDTSVFVKKSDVVDVVESGNMNPVTSNAVAEVADSLEPVDTVTSGNMHSVTSNAVAEAVDTKQTRWRAIVSGNGSYIDITPVNDAENYIVSYGYASSGFTNFGIIYYQTHGANIYFGYKDLVKGSNWITSPTVAMVNGKIRFTHKYADGTSSLVVKVS